MTAKIGHILLDNSFPRDPRVAKAVKALGIGGIGSAIFCLQGVNQSVNETMEVEGYLVDIRRVPGTYVGKANKIKMLLDNISTTVQPLLREWIEATRPDALHVHDLPYARTVLHVARDYEIPVVLDFHENWPAALEVYGKDKSGLHALAYRQYNGLQRWKKWELDAVQRADHIVVVVPEAIERFVAQGVAADKFTVVGNTDDESAIATNLDPVKIQRTSVQPTAIYTGFWGPHRGLDTIIAAAGIVAADHPTAELFVAGIRHQDELRFVQDKAIASGAMGATRDAVDFHLWMSSDDVWSYTMGAQIGMVPHNDCEHTQTTVPHKLFHFMLARKPVLVSDVAPLARIVESTGAGLVFRANDPQDCARQWLAMVNASDEQRKAWGDAGYAAATTGEFAWRCDAERLAALYRTALTV